MAQSKTDGRPIVRTDSVLGGDPRVEGTRIGVHHIVYPILESDYTIERMTTATYPDLTEGDVLAALAYYAEHRDEIDEIRIYHNEVPDDAITGPDDLPPELRSD